MNKEERNRIMDGYLIDYTAPPVTQEESNLYDAIRECDNLARAWDELQQIVLTRRSSRDGYNSALKYIEQQMDLLVSPPPPKDPLEVLEEWAMTVAKGVSRDEGLVRVGFVAVKLKDLRAEIRRLRGTK